MVVRAAGGKKRSEERVVEVVDNEDEKFGTKEEGAASWVLTPQRLRSILRWACVTVWWMVVTQWFFGPALIDRGFTFTGGACELIRDESSRMEMGEIKEFVTAATCKIAGGQWKGGHDVSGHVFILVLGSASVGLEILGSMIGEQMRSEGVVDEGEGDGEGGQLGKWGWGVVVGVVGMSWWMLLMTAAYFHTWFEKVSLYLAHIDIEGYVEAVNIANGDMMIVYGPPHSVPRTHGRLHISEIDTWCPRCSRYTRPIENLPPSHHTLLWRSPPVFIPHSFHPIMFELCLPCVLVDLAAGLAFRAP